MPHESSNEFPEHRLTRELVRIGADLLSEDRKDRSLMDLYEVLVRYDSEVNCDSQDLVDPGARPVTLTHGSLDHHLSLLVEMVQDTRLQLRSRALKLMERVEALDSVCQANFMYGGGIKREFAPQSSPTINFQT